MYMYDNEQLICVNMDTLSTSVVDVKQMLLIREPLNVSHYKHMIHDCEYTLHR